MPGAAGPAGPLAGLDLGGTLLAIPRVALPFLGRGLAPHGAAGPRGEFHTKVTLGPRPSTITETLISAYQAKLLNLAN